MADTTYRVVLALETTGALGAKLGELAPIAKRVGDGLASVSGGARLISEGIGTATEKLGASLSKVTDRAFELGKHLAFATGAAAVGGLAYSVGHLNAQLEETGLSLATVFQSQGLASDFTGAMGLATEQVGKMKADVKSLPGDLGQLSNIMKMIATPAAQGGADADQIRSLSGRGMLAATVLGVDQDVAARELAQLFAGRAGSHNILGSRLGLVGGKAEAFNKESASARVKDITALFNSPAMNAAATEFGKTWKAQTTTLADNLKYALAAPATGGLFEAVKHSMAGVSDYFDTHKREVAEYAALVDEMLVAGWHKVEDIFRRIEPIAARFGASLVSLTPEKVGHALEKAGGTMLGLKVGGMAMEGLGGMLAGGGMGGLAESIGAMGAAGALAMPMFVLAAGAADDLTDSTNRFHEEATTAAGELKDHVIHTLLELAPAAEHAGAKLRDFVDLAGAKALDGLALVSRVGDQFSTDVLGPMESKFGLVSTAALDALGPLGMLADVLGRCSDAKAKYEDANMATPPPSTGHVLNLKPDMTDYSVFKWMNEPKPMTGAGGGGGGTHIDKVEIIVHGNSDPSRVAELTVEHLKKLAKNPGRSGFVPDFSQAHSRL